METDVRGEQSERPTPGARVRPDDIRSSVSRSRALVDRAGEVVQTARDLRTAIVATRARRAYLTRQHSVVQQTDQAAERRVFDNLGLARQLASRFTGRGQPFDDLYQVACLGLVKASERFDPDRGVLFRTYAQAVITGELKRHFRDHGWGLHVTRPVQELFLAVRSAREDLTHSLGHAPTIAQIAAAVGSDEESVVDAMHAGETFYLDSLDAPVAPGDPAPRHDTAVHESGFARVDDRSWLVPAIEQLADRDRAILQMRFFEGLSQSQIAARLGISQMHVSRLLSRSLSTLRKAATDEPAYGSTPPSAAG